MLCSVNNNQCTIIGLVLKIHHWVQKQFDWNKLWTHDFGGNKTFANAYELFYNIPKTIKHVYLFFDRISRLVWRINTGNCVCLNVFIGIELWITILFWLKMIILPNLIQASNQVWTNIKTRQNTINRNYTVGRKCIFHAKEHNSIF